MLNLLALAMGPAGKPLLDQPWLFTAVAVALSIAVGAVHYVGLGTGKWLSNVGGAANFVLIGLLAITAVGVGLKQGSATDFVHASYRPPLDANGAILWATMVFGVAGSEALAFMRNDVRGGMRTILGVLATVALVQIAFYFAGTGSLLVILSPQTATRLSGLPDALILGLKTLGLGGVAPLVLFGSLSLLARLLQRLVRRWRAAAVRGGHRRLPAGRVRPARSALRRTGGFGCGANSDRRRHRGDFAGGRVAEGGV